MHSYSVLANWSERLGVTVLFLHKMGIMFSSGMESNMKGEIINLPKNLRRWKFPKIKQKRNSLLFVFFDWQRKKEKLLGKCDISTLHNGKRNGNACGHCSHCFANQKYQERSNRKDGRAWDSFHSFVKKGWCALADWRNQIQVCFWSSKRPLDAKFQNKIKNNDSLLHNVCHLSSKNKFQFSWYMRCLNKVPQVSSKAANAYST